MNSLLALIIAIPLTFLFIWIVGCVGMIIEAFFRFVCEVIRETFRSIGSTIRSAGKGLILHEELKPWTLERPN